MPGKRMTGVTTASLAEIAAKLLHRMEYPIQELLELRNIQIWVPLVDALRTCLLAPTSELGEILDHVWPVTSRARSF